MATILEMKELLDTLRALESSDDAEVAHSRADQALLEYINDSEVTEAFENVPKWYA